MQGTSFNSLQQEALDSTSALVGDIEMRIAAPLGHIAAFGVTFDPEHDTRRMVLQAESVDGLLVVGM